MAREVRLWEWLRNGLKPVPKLHMRRVENLVSEGDPDVEGCWDGKYFELELKGCDRPPLNGKLLFDVRQSQVLWHRKRWRCGGNVWLYIRVGKAREVRRYLLPGKLTALVKEGVTENDLRQMSVLPYDHSPLDVLQQAVDTSPFR